MDLAQELVRKVMRAFYDTKHILVIDALILHSALRDDDMVYLMGLQSKELHKLCGRLREDRLLSVHTRAEAKEGQNRPITRTWYFIDYRATIDAIKWKMYSIDKRVQGNKLPTEERKAWACSRCKSQWTMMEVLDKPDPRGHGFLCHKCGFLLSSNSDDDHGGHEQSSRLNKQFNFITSILPQIDKVLVPESTFDTALAKAQPVIRDYLNQVKETVPVDQGSLKPTAVRGLTNTGPTSVAVTLTTSDGPTAADKEAERARREALAAQNQLPSHFTHSTVTGEQILPGLVPTFTNSMLEDAKSDKKEKVITPSNDNGAEIDDYFAQLKAEAAREAAKAEEEELETDDEDDEEDGFEDVVPTGSGSGANTPASSSSVNGSLANGGLPSAMKRSASDMSRESTGVASPVIGPHTPNSERTAKKVRVELPTPKDDEESEEDVDFEDV